MTVRSNATIKRSCDAKVHVGATPSKAVRARAKFSSTSEGNSRQIAAARLPISNVLEVARVDKTVCVDDLLLSSPGFRNKEARATTSSCSSSPRKRFALPHAAPPTERGGEATVQHSEILETRVACSIAFWTCRTSRSVVPRLPPEMLHRVIQSCGLEDCGELVALATPDQLARVFDLDLWRTGQPGLDEQFDADRFGVWLEVLVESGASRRGAETRGDGRRSGDRCARAARCASSIPRRYRRLRRWTEKRWPRPAHVDDGLGCDVGGYLVVARRTDSWDAIVAVLVALDAEHHDYFHRVMRGCRSLSNSRPEVDGLDDLLTDREQVMFDLAFDRERRREQQGYVTPAQARAFLQMSRQLRLGHDTDAARQSRRPRVFPSHRMDDGGGREERVEPFAAGIRRTARSGGLRRCGRRRRRGAPRGGCPRAAASSVARRTAGPRAAPRAHPGADAVRARPR